MGRDFDGLDDFIDCGNVSGHDIGAGSFSICAWINADTFAGGGSPFNF